MQADDGQLWLDRDGFVEFFAPDIDPFDTQILAASQKPIAASLFLGEEPFGVPAWSGLPSWFVVSELDQMLPPAAQHAMAGRAGSIVTSVDASHVALISQAETVADVILNAARVAATTPTIGSEAPNA